MTEPVEDGARRFSGAAASSSSDGNHRAIVPSSSTALSAAASAAAGGVKRFVRQQVPDSVLHNDGLNEAIRALPANYNFEIHKTVWRLQQAGAKQVAVQFPEGLLMYACVISDILERFAGATHVFILGDVTFGACCVDDFSAVALGADFLVHYGHSCLVPVDVTTLPCLYVFVDIAIDIDHLVATVALNFPAGTRLALAGTIQFSTAIQLGRQRLAGDYPSLDIPKVKPLSPGEVLGCTAPVLPKGNPDAPSPDALLFVADGRFHLEAIMIANPELPAFRYDPYARALTRERYDQRGMRSVRRRMIERARNGGPRWAVVLGTLGRQGNPHIVTMLQGHLSARGLPFVTLLMSEISPSRLAAIEDVDVFVQVACPRLSIDWGEGFARPTLTPYEALIALGEVPAWWEEAGGRGADTNDGDAGSIEPYPMDYYSKDGGVWNSSWHKNAAKAARPAGPRPGMRAAGGA
ncbi:hypothetical protein FOA52_009232 [Chlamydomonas sp. UWO 241]|nr:hypothetical protein FOA52_009232 [Chlamydomonas sp. UWO 241]